MSRTWRDNSKYPRALVQRLIFLQACQRSVGLCYRQEHRRGRGQFLDGHPQFEGATGQMLDDESLEGAKQKEYQPNRRAFAMCRKVFLRNIAHRVVCPISSCGHSHLKCWPNFVPERRTPPFLWSNRSL